MTKKHAIGLMVPVLLLAAMFGIKWRQDHPPFSEADLALQKAAIVVDKIIIRPMDEFWSPGTGLASFYTAECSDRKKIRQVMGLLRCFGDFSDEAPATHNNPPVDLQISLVKRLKNGELDRNHSEELRLTKSGNRYYLVREYFDPAYCDAAKSEVVQDATPVNPRLLPHFLHAVRALVASARQKNSHVFISPPQGD